MNRHRLDSPATSSRTVLTFHLKDNLDNAKIKPTHKKLATQMLEGEHSSASKRGLKDVLLRGDDLFIAPAPKKPKSIGISQPQGKNEAPLKARKTGTDPKSTKTKAPGKPKLAKDPNCAKVPRKSRAPKVTLESDPTIITDNAKISTLLSQGKTWREIANYFPDHNTDSIKKRYNVCRNVVGQTFSPEDDEKLKNFLAKYEKEKFVAASKELGKTVKGVIMRAKELKLV